MNYSVILALLMSLVSSIYVHLENPADCERWYDGCNTCIRESIGEGAACTEMACVRNAGEYCLENFDGDTWDSREEYLEYLGHDTRLRTGGDEKGSSDDFASNLAMQVGAMVAGLLLIAAQ
uniref:Uncharacterized protein n=1 Tax=Strombidium inclinatum TaxID=197538 RepID=A0A7S3ITP9_9SPIT